MFRQCISRIFISWYRTRRIIMKESANRFPLTEAAVELSKMLFHGIILRIVVANGIVLNDFAIEQHDFLDLEVFPENHLSLQQHQRYVEDLCRLKSDMNAKHPETFKTTEVVIITNNTSIITSAPKELVRIATADGLIEPKNQTFSQNQLDFLCDYIQGIVPSVPAEFFKAVLADINKKEWESDETKKEDIMKRIEMCGDSLIYFTLYRRMGIEKRLKDI
jgi:hypothetical protein